MKVPPMLVKLLMLTTSPHDGEALTAIRKANALLASANVNWEEFLGAVQITQDQSFRTPPSQRRYKGDDDANSFSDVGKGSSQRFTDGKIINPMFDAAFANASGGFSNFLDSVHEWWEEKGFLTEKQYYAIKRAAEKV